jgi:hypothetical protein
MSAMRKDLNTSKGCKMSAAHYRFIAEVIRKMPDHAPTLRAQKVSVANAFSAALQQTNPMFKADRFFAACIEGMTADSV